MDGGTLPRVALSLLSFQNPARRSKLVKESRVLTKDSILHQHARFLDKLGTTG